MNKPYALITTPAEASQCPECRDDQDFPVVGIRYPDAPNTYPHCPVCGTTSLIDTRSPWEVMAEALKLVDEPGIDPGLKMQRRDNLDEICRVAVAVADDCQCMDCRKFRPFMKNFW